MKKVLVSVVAVLAFALTSNAQLWIGGSIGASHTGGVEKNDPLNGGDDTKYAKTNRVSISPKIGVDLSDKLAVGFAVNYSTSTTGKMDKDNKTKTNVAGVTPFLRYTFAEFGKFGILAEVGVPVSYEFGKIVAGGNDTKTNRTLSYGLDVAPWLTYGVSDNFSLECGLNFMGLYATHSVETDQNDKDHKWKNNTMGIRANSANLVNVGGLTIGFIYKF